MYRSLLVLLDRSSFAEQALPVALSIARRANARLDLVVVYTCYELETPPASWAPFDRRLDAEWQRQESVYLDATARWLRSVAPVCGTTAVLPGSNMLAELVADGIRERVRACRTDLIVLASHARGLFGRLGFGSVADELVRRAGVPVLVLPGREPAHELIPEPVLEDVLIPLDGSPLAEQALGPAFELARLLEARCSLLRVVQPPSCSQEAGEYLKGVAAGFQGEGLAVQTRVLVAPEAASAIREAASQPSSVIALATHGRGGLNRLLLGSVANKLVRAAASPVLVHRPKGRCAFPGGWRRHLSELH
jgi:nucleotide-binding universal stress UspA family protein